MKRLKAISLILSILLIMSSVTLFAAAEGKTALSLELGIEPLREQFEFGIGPETEGFSIDYRYYSPAGENDENKYPLVIWLHGMGDGSEDGRQIDTNNVANWVSAEYQSRFTNGGAYIMAPRSVEEQKLFWTDELILPLRAAIDDFIAKNENVDVSRIYIGGYSMGGKMTLKMAVAYPEMFAAAFPICPAWAPEKEATAFLSDIPVWLVSSLADPLVNYFSWVMPTWENIMSSSTVKENCRFSTLSLVAYANGVPAISNHYAWFAVNNDMFSDKNGKYPFMKTVDGNGDKVELEHPNGMISWLCNFTSDYDGSAATDGGNSEAKGDYKTGYNFKFVVQFMKYFVKYIFSCLKFR